MTRPDRLVVVTGSGTGVGKTWISAKVLAALVRRRVRVAARKPAQSFEPGGEQTDAAVLANATGEQEEAVCPAHRTYERPLAPPIAAAVLGRPPIRLEELVAELRWPDAIDVGLVEGVGGPRSPLANDGDTVDLARLIEPDLIAMVADPGLGVINATRLTLAPFEGLAPLVVVLNRFDAALELHAENRRWLAATGVDVVVGADSLVARLDPSVVHG